MKLATYKDGSRDGQLVVVSRDLATAHFATGIATRLQQVLDDWNFLSPQLQDLYVTLNQGKARHAFAFEPRQCMAPLPRAFQWVQAEAYPTTADPEPASPALHQAGSDRFLGPQDEAWFGSAAWEIDLGAQLAVVTGDVDMGCSPEQGLDAVRLLLLANAWHLHQPPGGSAGPRGPQDPASRPAAGFAAVALTPDELGEAWRGGRLQAQLQVTAQGRRLGLLDTAAGMAHPFGVLLAQLARTRHVRAGTLLGSGPVRQPSPGAGAASQGHASLADKRARELADTGSARSPWLALGDTVRIELKTADGQSPFGALQQRVTGPGDEAADAPTQDLAEPPVADLPDQDGLAGGRPATADDTA